MKKILSILVIFVLFALPSSAKVFKGKAINEISTEKPTNTISIKAVRNFDMQGTKIKKGDIVTGVMTDKVAPKGWHHNASFTFIPQYYTDKDGKQHKIDKHIKASYRQKMKPDFKHSTISGGPLTFSPGYISDSKRALQGEGKEVVDEYVNRTTPWGKGTEIIIKPNEVIYFNFPD